MEVAILSRGVYPRLLGGREIFVHGLAKALADRGCGVRLVTEQGAALEHAGVKVIAVPVVRVRGLELLAYGMNFVGSLPGLSGVGIIHVHSPGANMLLGGVAAAMLDVPFVVTIHSMAAASRRWIWTLRAADRVVAVSTSLANRLADVGVARERLRVIPSASSPGRPTAPRDEVRRRLGVGSGDLAFLYHGRLVPGKGLETLVDAFAALREQDAYLLIVGDGPLRSILERRLADAHVRGRCVGRVPHTDIWDFLAAADVSVLPSSSEGSPLAIFEAMSMGLPVLAADAPGLRDFVHEGENGLLVPAEDAQSLAEAMERVLRDPALRKSMVERTIEMGQQYSMDRCVERHLGMYRELLGPAP